VALFAPLVALRFYDEKSGHWLYRTYSTVVNGLARSQGGVMDATHGGAVKQSTIEDFYVSVCESDLKGMATAVADGALINGPMDMDEASALHLAAVNGDVDAMQWLVSNGADMEALDKNGQTPFLSAAIDGSVAALEWLVSKGANTAAFSSDATPLQEGRRSSEFWIVGRALALASDPEITKWLRELEQKLSEALIAEIYEKDPDPCGPELARRSAGKKKKRKKKKRASDPASADVLAQLAPIAGAGGGGGA
jgi:hypothetical protein